MLFLDPKVKKGKAKEICNNLKDIYPALTFSVIQGRGGYFIRVNEKESKETEETRLIREVAIV